jgi:hypothetical protein
MNELDCLDVVSGIHRNGAFVEGYASTYQYLFPSKMDWPFGVDSRTISAVQEMLPEWDVEGRQALENYWENVSWM